MGSRRPIRPVQRLQRQRQTPNLLQVTMSNHPGRIGRARSPRRIIWSAVVVAFMQWSPAGIADETNPASFKISGYGPIGNRQLARVVRMLQPGSRVPATYDPSFVEDAAVII